MSQYIKTFNTRDEYNAWASGYTEGYAVSAYIISENSLAGKEYTPFLQASADATAFEYPATSTTLHIKSNLNWTITKPAWVTMESAGTCSADITMTIAANDESKTSRSGNVVISYNQTSSETITLTQQGNPSYTGVPTNEIWYTTTDGNSWEPYNEAEFKDAASNNLTILSNTYSEGKGILVFDGAIDSMYNAMSYVRPRLQTIQIPNSVTTIGYGVFNGSSDLTSVTLSNRLVTIGESAFGFCRSLYSITIPDGVTSIGDSAFNTCTSLTGITIPNSVTSIGNMAFSYCTSFTGITIPSGVTSLGYSLFYYDNNLLKVTMLPQAIPSGGSNILYNADNCQLYVPSNLVNAYKSTYPWSNYASRIQAIPE